MKNWEFKIALVVFLGSLSFTNCSKDKNGEPDPGNSIKLDTLIFTHSMKGWELYSWPDAADWNYSILVGTNRLKSYDEVVSNKIRVCGSDSLKLLLDKFPEKEFISWIGQEWLSGSWQGNYGSFSLPDSSTVHDIVNYCKLKGLILYVMD